MREKQNVYEVFFTFFIFYFESPHSFWKFLKIWFCTFWYINRQMLEKFFFFEFFSWNFFFHKKKILMYVDLCAKCAESNFKKLSEWMLVSLTFLKKFIWEKTYFLESSKVWGLIKPKRKDKSKKWDWTFLDFFLLFQKKLFWLVTFSRCVQ